HVDGAGQVGPVAVDGGGSDSVVGLHTVADDVEGGGDVAGLGAADREPGAVAVAGARLNQAQDVGGCRTNSAAASYHQALRSFVGALGGGAHGAVPGVPARRGCLKVAVDG